MRCLSMTIRWWFCLIQKMHMTLPDLSFPLFVVQYFEIKRSHVANLLHIHPDTRLTHTMHGGK